MRSRENTIYFASVNYALRHQESATSLLGPEGECLAHVPYGEERLLVRDLDLARATGVCARRFNPASEAALLGGGRRLGRWSRRPWAGA